MFVSKKLSRALPMQWRRQFRVSGRMKADVEGGLKKRLESYLMQDTLDPFEKTNKVREWHRKGRERWGRVGGKILSGVVARYHALKKLYLEMFLYDMVCLDTTYTYYICIAKSIVVYCNLKHSGIVCM